MYTNLLLNVTSRPISERHIAWCTMDAPNNNILLVEVVERFYPHPNLPDHAAVSRIEIDHLDQYKRTSEDGAVLILLEAAQKATTKLMQKKAVSPQDVEPIDDD